MGRIFLLKFCQKNSAKLELKPFCWNYSDKNVFLCLNMIKQKTDSFIIAIWLLVSLEQFLKVWAKSAKAIRRKIHLTKDLSIYSNTLGKNFLVFEQCSVLRLSIQTCNWITDVFEPISESFSPIGWLKLDIFYLTYLMFDLVTHEF